MASSGEARKCRACMGSGDDPFGFGPVRDPAGSKSRIDIHLFDRGNFCLEYWGSPSNMTGRLVDPNAITSYIYTESNDTQLKVGRHLDSSQSLLLVHIDRPTHKRNSDVRPIHVVLVLIEHSH